MGTAGATQLCWVILSFLLLRGHNSQPTTMQPSSPQAASEKASRIPTAPSKPVMPRSSTMDGHSPSQPQEHTSGFGVISFIVILVVVVIILVSVVSLRFKCQKNKESEDPQKPGSSGLSESCSAANGEKDSITLISMKNINMNNSKGCRSAEKVL
ncbi:PREDICTED: endothelial cell-specific chemotaxis regulator isoform X4 [Myotis brandtii]|uniref:endothelial cell-specific chemotaxis regulator isoform X4 n=1 Tax=Myotis brandtii TaxID=109478 RepID=UPI0007044CBE|nr:PREDICTED: endothelial cell-specific chemotaxis regulator isoform X4 [Myotis brandtii]